MEYGKISNNESIDRTIHQCFAHLSASEKHKFYKKFCEQPHNGTQVMHTFRELVLGAYLMQQGFQVEHDREIHGKTPDWTGMDKAGNTILFECFSFHPNLTMDKDISAHMDAGEAWAGFIPPHSERLYKKTQNKVAAYKSLAEDHGYGMVVAIFGNFETVLDHDEVVECMTHKDEGLFQQYPCVGGVLHFQESGGVYGFSYIQNPRAKIPIFIPDGKLATVSRALRESEPLL